MIGPEPDQPLDKSGLGAESRFDAGLGLRKIDRPPWIGHGFGGGLFRHLLGVLLGSRHHGGRFRHLLWLCFLLLCFLLLCFL